MDNKVKKELMDIMWEENIRLPYKKYSSLSGFSRKADWKYISSRYGLSNEFIFEFQDNIVWNELVQNKNISSDTLSLYSFKINPCLMYGTKSEVSSSIKKDIEIEQEWRSLYNEHKYNLRHVSYKSFVKNCDWENLCATYDLSANFIKYYFDKISWTDLSYNTKIKLETLAQFFDKVNWYAYTTGYATPFLPHKEKVFKGILLAKYLHDKLHFIKLNIDGKDYNDLYVIHKLKANQNSLLLKEQPINIEIDGLIELYKNICYILNKRRLYVPNYKVVEIEPIDNQIYDYIVYVNEINV